MENSNPNPKVFARIMHRLAHAPAAQIKNSCAHAFILTPKLEIQIDNVSKACGICRRTGRPAASIKVSLMHVNAAFNTETKIDFAYQDIGGSKYKTLIFMNTVALYTEGKTETSRKAETVMPTLENYWILMHVAPSSTSADDEYNQTKTKPMLTSHNITFKPGHRVDTTKQAYSNEKYRQ